MKRHLVAVLACRVTGTRLYGKPVQNLEAGKTILDQILDTIEHLPPIDDTVLAISEGIENQVFVRIAKERGIPYVFGDEIDVLSRLIAGARITAATDVFRVTTECPFLYFEPLADAWRDHVGNGNDVTVTDGLPEGTAFEIYTTNSLIRSHEQGTSWHRSEGCSRYAREHRSDFRVDVRKIPAECARLDLRLTVDYPEDLALCRHVYRQFRDAAPLIPLTDIIRFLDEHPEHKKIVEPYVVPKPVWG